MGVHKANVCMKKAECLFCADAEDRKFCGTGGCFCVSDINWPSQNLCGSVVLDLFATLQILRR